MADSTETTFTNEELWDLLERSGLLNSQLLAAQRERFQRPGITPNVILMQMMSEQLLTTFQAKQLAERRYRGFFLSEKYKILNSLGQGGMSKVLLCEHLLLQRLVAVKVLHKTLDKFPGAAERFLREARASASMDHPNIARVFDVDRTSLGSCIVMEFVDGTNLHDLVAKRGRLAIDRVANYISQAATGLQQAHQAGLVHRDVKPANLMLDRSGTIKLLDLGLARFFDPKKSDNLTVQIDESSIIGTADFIAPEQVMESSKADIRADIYSLGYSMYFMLTRTFPAGTGSSMRKMVWHQTREPEPIRSLRPEVPVEMAQVIERMIKKNPNHRYQTPAEVIEALAPWMTPVPPPSDDELPRIKASSFRLGLCPPPDSARLARMSQIIPSPKSPPPVSRVATSAIRPQTPSVVSSGSMIGYTNPQESMSPASRVAATKTSDVMSSSTQTDNASRSAFLRNLTDSQRLARGLVDAVLPPQPTSVSRRLVPLFLAMFVAFGIGGWAVHAYLTGKFVPAANNSVVNDGRQTTIAAKDGQSTVSVPRTEVTQSAKPPVKPIQPDPISESAQPAVASTGIVLRGGGSTFIKPAMEFWSKGFERKFGVKVEYSAQGSSKGIEGVTANFLDFGCTDAYISDAILEKENNIIHIPLAMGAVVPTYNLTNAAGEALQMRFTGAILANIYLGKIRKWNDKAISVVNPEIELPDVDISVVYRQDGSGTTAIWTDYLSKVSSAWKEKVGKGSKDLKWPIGTGAEKNDGVAQTVNRISGAIGYVELSYALANDLPAGLVQNKSGEFVEPSVEGITAAARASLRGIPDDLRFSLTDAHGHGSYPIIGTCWAVLRTEGERRGPLVEFLRWATTEGQAGVVKLHYGRLPEEFADRIKILLDKVAVSKT